MKTPHQHAAHIAEVIGYDPTETLGADLVGALAVYLEEEVIAPAVAGLNMRLAVQTELRKHADRQVAGVERILEWLTVCDECGQRIDVETGECGCKEVECLQS